MATALNTDHEDAESVGARAAANVDAGARRHAVDEQHCAPTIGTLMAAKGYATAASLRGEMETRTEVEEARARPPPSAACHGRAANAEWEFWDFGTEMLMRWRRASPGVPCKRELAGDVWPCPDCIGMQARPPLASGTPCSTCR